MVQWLRICTDFAEFGFNCLKLQLQENSMPLQAPTHEYTIKKINLPKICCRKMKTTIPTKSTVRHEREFVCVRSWDLGGHLVFCSITHFLKTGSLTVVV